MRKAFFAGSFDPFTIAHKDIVDRALCLFDEVVIGIGENSDKHYSLTAEERAASIRAVFQTEARVSVIIYSGLTADAAHKADCQCLIRGIRNAADYVYEADLASANREIADIETIWLPTRAEYTHISSSLVRDLIKYNKSDKYIAK